MLMPIPERIGRFQGHKIEGFALTASLKSLYKNSRVLTEQFPPASSRNGGPGYMFSRIKKVYLQIFAVSLLGVSCCSSMFGQQTLGGITGTITDASGGTVPDASVTVIQNS